MLYVWRPCVGCALDDDTLPALVEDMLETMKACDGVGLAAPRIDVPLRIIVFGGDENPRYPDAAPVPRTVLMNPEIAPAGQAVHSEWEVASAFRGCADWFRDTSGSATGGWMPTAGGRGEGGGASRAHHPA